MKSKLFIFSFLLVTFCFSDVLAKKGYSIQVKVKGLTGGQCFLANHFGDKQYLQDSAMLDANGKVKFERDESLAGGMYLLVFPDKRYFEMMIDKEQFFSVEADTTLNPENIHFKNTIDNQQFYDYLTYIGKKNKMVEPLRQRYNALGEEEKKTSSVREQMAAIDDDVKKYKEDFKKKNPNAFLTTIFNLSETPDVPPAPKNPDGSIDSSFQYKYYKSHFWDKVNFADARMLRTPIFHAKLVEYFENLVYKIPDSINADADFIVKKAEADTEVFKYTVWFITYHYETSKIMGLDAVFVHMVKNYYTKEKAYWLSADGLYKIQSRAAQLDPILVGKKPRNIVLQDTSGVYQSMYDIKAKYTVLVFWEPDCGHCQKVVPKVKEFYDRMKSKGVEVYAADTETEGEKWRKFIREKNLDFINVMDPNLRDNFRHDFDVSTTPQLFLLDKDKKIIAKKIEIDQIEEMINRELKLGE